MRIKLILTLAAMFSAIGAYVWHIATITNPAPRHAIIQILHGNIYVQDHDLTLNDCAQLVTHYPHAFCASQPE